MLSLRLCLIPQHTMSCMLWASFCTYTQLSLSCPLFPFSQQHTYTHSDMHKGSWLSGGCAYASQADSDVCAGVRRWCASKRSQEKYDEAFLQVLCVCSKTCPYVCVSKKVCCLVGSSAFYPHPLSKHNKHGWIHLSSFEAYDTTMYVACT